MWTSKGKGGVGQMSTKGEAVKNPQNYAALGARPFSAQATIFGPISHLVSCLI